MTRPDDRPIEKFLDWVLPYCAVFVMLGLPVFLIVWGVVALVQR